MRTKHSHGKQYLDIVNAPKKQVAPNLTTLYEINIKGPFCAVPVSHVKLPQGIMYSTRMDCSIQNRYGFIILYLRVL